MNFLFDRVEYIVGKVETAGYQHQFSLFSTVFERLLFQDSKTQVLLDNSLPNDKILALTKLRRFADDKFSVAKMIISGVDGVEKIVGEGENAGYWHFLFFPQSFQILSLSGSLKVMIVCYRVMRYNR